MNTWIVPTEVIIFRKNNWKKIDIKTVVSCAISRLCLIETDFGVDLIDCWKIPVQILILHHIVDIKLSYINISYSIQMQTKWSPGWALGTWMSFALWTFEALGSWMSFALWKFEALGTWMSFALWKFEVNPMEQIFPESHLALITAYFSEPFRHLYQTLNPCNCELFQIQMFIQDLTTITNEIKRMELAGTSIIPPSSS